jgi:hypothetical protein
MDGCAGLLADKGIQTEIDAARHERRASPGTRAPTPAAQSSVAAESAPK